MAHVGTIRRVGLERYDAESHCADSDVSTLFAQFLKEVEFKKINIKRKRDVAMQQRLGIMRGFCEEGHAPCGQSCCAGSCPNKLNLEP